MPRLELPPGLLAVVLRQAGSGDPVAWLERAVLAYVAAGAAPSAAPAAPAQARGPAGRKLTPAEKQRAYRERKAAKAAGAKP